MKRARGRILVGVQICALMFSASVALGYDYSTGKTQMGPGTDDAQEVIVNALIDVLAGAYNPSSPYYDREFAQATKNDFKQLFISTRRLVQHDDFDQLITGFDKIMALNDNPDPGKNTLAKYLKQIFKAMAPIMEPDPLEGLLVSLASIDTASISSSNGIIKGLDMTVTNNIYGQDRTKSDINTSALRSLLVMFASADYTPTFVVRGKDTGIPYLSMVDSPDHPLGEAGTVSGQTHNLAEWAIGEIVTSLRWGREGKIKQGGAYVSMDQFQAFDWLMFKKKYHVSGHGYEPLKFEGLISVASDRVAQVLVPAALIESFPAALELGGGIKDVKHHGGNEGCLTNTPWRTCYGTAGSRHKLLALASPVLDYFWYAKDAQGHRRVRDLVKLVVSLNEIPCADYQSLETGVKATFRNDGGLAGKSVLKIVEDSGVMNAVLRPHGTDDMGLAAPALDLLVRVIAKVNMPKSAPAEYRRLNPYFYGDTLLDAVSAEMQVAQAKLSRMPGMQGDPIDRIIDALFLPLSGQTESVVTKIEKAAYVAARAAKDKQFVTAFRADLENLVDAAEQMVMSADLENIYKALDMVLALNDSPDPGENTLARFSRNALNSISDNLDMGTIKGLILTTASIDRSALEGKNNVGEGLVQLMERNIYGQLRDTADVKTCALRALLFMVPLANKEQHLELAGIDSGLPLLSLLDSPDHPASEPGTVKDQTTNTAEWAIGELVTALRWGREGKFMIDGKDVILDQYQAFDWVMYKKRYTIQLAGLHVPLVSFNGLAGMLSSPFAALVLPDGIADVFPAAFEIGGGMSDAEYALGAMDGFTETSWRDRYGTAGRRHKLLALVMPLMEYAWTTKDAQGRRCSSDLVQVLAGLNEIPLPPAYEGLKKFSKKNPNATLRLDNQKGVLKTVQDSNLLVYVMQPRGKHDILVPAMNLFGLVVAKLTEKDSGLIYKETHPGFKGNTLMDALFMEIMGSRAQSGKSKDLVDPIITALFTPQAGDSMNTVSKMQSYIHRIVGSMYGNPAGTHNVAQD